MKQDIQIKRWGYGNKSLRLNSWSKLSLPWKLVIKLLENFWCQKKFLHSDSFIIYIFYNFTILQDLISRELKFHFIKPSHRLVWILFLKITFHHHWSPSHRFQGNLPFQRFWVSRKIRIPGGRWNNVYPWRYRRVYRTVHRTEPQPRVLL